MEKTILCKHRHLFLIGPMGAGKTTVGQALAQQMARVFYDTDQIMERQQGRSVSEIFANDGEARFRVYESTVLRDLCRHRDAVIATGGGVVLDEDNRRLLKDHGFVVYLHAGIETQMQRINDNSRPLLNHHDKRTVLARLASERNPLYEAIADCKINTGQRTDREVAASVQQALQRVER